MSKVKGDYWKTEENSLKLQIKTRQSQYKLEEALQGWQCVSYGYVPRTSEDIYVFEKKFESEIDLINFLSSDKIKKIFEMKEVLN